MTLAPFGELPASLKARRTGLYTPMYEWSGTQPEFETLLDAWLDEVAAAIWPHWDGSAWVGAADKNKEATTKAELELAVKLYHGKGTSKDILEDAPQGVAGDMDGNPLSHDWHYKIEDALVLDPQYAYIPLADGQEPSFDYLASRDVGSNYLAYDRGINVAKFENLFWGRMRGLQPPLFDIKEYFQRPRPWTAATALGVEDFRWTTATGSTHTGVHPSILSGHCIQGILGGCAVFDALLDEIKTTGTGLSEPTIRSIQKYMVDWGDRRVFAGVHYMTDNIASWTLARKLIPFLFRNAQEVENFAVAAIVGHSQVFKDIKTCFDPKDPAKILLLDHFSEELNPASMV